MIESKRPEADSHLPESGIRGSLPGAWSLAGNPSRAQCSNTNSLNSEGCSGSTLMLQFGILGCARTERPPCMVADSCADGIATS